MANLHRLMSFNINGLYGDRANTWEMRAPINVGVIQKYRPHVIGMQEVAPQNFDTYKHLLPQYDIVYGVSYAEADSDEKIPILFDSSTYDLLESGHFWLSETPDKESSAWEIDYPLAVTWVKLKLVANGETIFCLNTHFEDGPWGETHRQNSTQVILNKLEELAPNYPTFLLGDFNCNPWSAPYRTFLDHGFKDSYREAGHGDSAGSSTMHLYKGPDYFGLDWGGDVYWRVDWILSRGAKEKQVQASSSAIIHDAMPPTYPSDHYPMLSEFLIY